MIRWRRTGRSSEGTRTLILGKSTMNSIDFHWLLAASYFTLGFGALSRVKRKGAEGGGGGWRGTCPLKRSPRFATNKRINQERHHCCRLVIHISRISSSHRIIVKSYRRITKLRLRFMAVRLWPPPISPAPKSRPFLTLI